MNRSNLQLTAQGAGFIAAWEGYRAAAYNDSDVPPNATIGIGHKLHDGPVTAADRKLSWSYPQAVAQLQKDVETNALAALRESLQVDLTPAQVAALCSLGINCGPGSLAAGHVVMAAVNSKPRRWNVLRMRAWHSRVRAAILEWAHPEVLRRRRLSEAWLFSTGRFRRPLNPYANS